MAEEHAAAEGAKGAAGLMTKKFGPLPVIVWVIAAGAIYWYMKKNAGSSSATGTAGSINPSTGLPYGSAADQAAVATQQSASTDSTTTSGSTVAGQYPDNGSWGRAAVNYLVGLGDDPSSSNEAIQSYLSSQPLNTQQQAMVNLAIQGIGAPPQLPGPTGTPVAPVVTPPSGVVYATNPPTGLSISSHTSTSITVGWSQTTNATGYTVRYGKTSDATDGQVSVASGAGSAVIGGLSPSTLYHIQVQATPAKSGDPYGSITATTDQQASTSPSPSPTAAPKPSTSSSTSRSYTVRSGDTLSGIASKLGIGSWQTLYNNNKSVIESTAKNHGYSSSDNGHWIFPGEVLHY
jgi:LysM repeat protein